jgi:hypothetical protein
MDAKRRPENLTQRRKGDRECTRIDANKKEFTQRKGEEQIIHRRSLRLRPELSRTVTKERTDLRFIFSAVRICVNLRPSAVRLLFASIRVHSRSPLRLCVRLFLPLFFCVFCAFSRLFRFLLSFCVFA